MIKKKRHIYLNWSKGIGYLFGAFMLLSFLGCGSTKNVAEANIYSKRKLFKESFHEANSEKMIGHNERAIELFEHCLMLEANNPAVHFALSDLYEKGGDKEKMLNHAEQAYQYSSKNKWYTLRLADLYFEREEYAKTADLYANIIDTEKNIDIKFKYVDALIRSERFETAITMLNEAEVETGKTPRISFTKHDLYIQLNEYDKAQNELDALIADNPLDSDTKIMVAEYYMQQNKLDESKKLIQGVIRNDPTYGQAYIMMADLELRANNVSGAFENLEKGFLSEDVELDRKLEILRGLVPYTAKTERDYKEMKAGVEKLFHIVYDPEIKNAKLHDYYGYFMVTNENFTKAESEYQLACDVDQSVFNTWLQLLNTQSKNESFEGMFENGQKAAELFPSQPLIYLLTGISAKELKKYEVAEEWFFLGKDLVVQDPQLRSEFLYQLGNMNYEQNNAKDGKFYFDQAIEIFAGNINVYAENAMRLMGADELDAAETEILKGITIAPTSKILLDTYGQILFAKKEYKSASDAFLKALYTNYFDGVVLEHYADALYFSNEKDKAFELWEEAIKYGNKSAVLKRKFEDKKYYKSE